MDDIERRLRIVVPEAAGVYGQHIPLSLQLLLSPREQQAQREYVVEREEAEEGERRGKEGDKEGEEKGWRKGVDGNEEKSGYPTAHREFVDRIKENQGKLEEAMAPLVVEALGLSGLRFVKAEAEVGVSKQHSVKYEVCSTPSAYGIQQEISRAEEEEAADGSLGMTSDGREENVGKDEEQVEMSANGLVTNEESRREGSSIDLEEEEEEETDYKGLGKGIHNKAFQCPQNPKEHTKAVKKYDWG
ncbi:uncharacterized protein MONOS_12830 [Monocercomonoides exilis]|uniref:uncharacterized protein n=1 Tax=Monocercomonoides exilis TaxID=2049356 RepID=UPI003559AA5B|nr:hypothetical protein MONOS_12830 [Monocercomonoides exilis]|eukprot:MONOS_12830.1-p1 / transcript=MONOS_12830.1 / gene=MONOS_12830 / organism=Monocercomonoides_exilis_PA203 / gene_product=unspecified product / transcript_product=unspecified product / location=Mono_scaffold00740:5080-6201(-) / protein_length=245 / sequence_SO=supercontig / SO=protein_coding / is_pseudo=false